MAPKCSVCDKLGEGNITISKCARCHNRFYCGQECQRADWTSHRNFCGPKKWYHKYRKGSDGHKHEGELELITWSSEYLEEFSGETQLLGWGTFLEGAQAEGMRKRYEREGSDPETLFKRSPHAFRWTCCGAGGDTTFGCDHHGSGVHPCTCDFCRMGKPIPESIYNEENPWTAGLNLARGPDPRSYTPALALVTAMGRKATGLQI